MLKEVPQKSTLQVVIVNKLIYTHLDTYFSILLYHLLDFLRQGTCFHHGHMSILNKSQQGKACRRGQERSVTLVFIAAYCAFSLLFFFTLHLFLFSHCFHRSLKIT